MKFSTFVKQIMKRIKIIDQANYSYYLKLLKEKIFFQASDDKFALIAKHKRE